MAKREKKGGRDNGIPNNFTVTLIEAFRFCFEDLQKEAGEEIGHLKAWAQEHPSDFYRICSKMIPQQITAEVTHRNKPAELSHDELVSIAKSGSTRAIGSGASKTEPPELH